VKRAAATKTAAKNASKKSRSNKSTKVSSLKRTKQTANAKKGKSSGKVLRLKTPKKHQGSKFNIKGTLLAGLLIALVVWSLYPLKQRAQQKIETRLLKARIASLKARNNGLGDEIGRLKSDDYIEQIARRDFGLVKPGESSLLVVPAEKDQLDEPNDEPEKTQERLKKKKPEDKNASESTKPKTGAKDKSGSKSVNRGENSGKNSDGGSQKSWWQRVVGFLDNLTGQTN